MIAAHLPIQRPRDAKLLVVDEDGKTHHRQRWEFADLLRPGDLLIANDAATLPASLAGKHVRGSQPIEVRLAAVSSLNPDAIRQATAIVFGAGDFRMRTEDRPLPSELQTGDVLQLGPLRARIVNVIVQPRLVTIEFDGTTAEIWEGLARHGRPIQYSHLPTALDLWDVWTPVAGQPVAFEPPSAGFVLDWRLLARLKERGVSFATVTHAAGISSTGDSTLDALLPFDEPYFIPSSTVGAVAKAQRVIAIGTSVVRALEHAASFNGSLHGGTGLATQRIGSDSRLRVVDAILSGTHEPGTSHYDLLRAFADEHTLRRADEQLNSHGYRTHEFGDSVFVENSRPLRRRLVDLDEVPAGVGEHGDLHWTHLLGLTGEYDAVRF